MDFHMRAGLGHVSHSDSRFRATGICAIFTSTQSFSFFLFLFGPELLLFFSFWSDVNLEAAHLGSSEVYASHFCCGMNFNDSFFEKLCNCDLFTYPWCLKFEPFNYARYLVYLVITCLCSFSYELKLVRLFLQFRVSCMCSVMPIPTFTTILYLGFGFHLRIVWIRLLYWECWVLRSRGLFGDCKLETCSNLNVELMCFLQTDEERRQWRTDLSSPFLFSSEMMADSCCQG